MQDYPNNITILLHTRIRGYPNIKYEPSMSIPGIKSKTVFFDPLIKLNNKVIESSDQFFNKGEFDSLLNRTISSSYLGQRKIDFDTAKKNGYIDNNIQVTLNQLFKPNSLFYVKGNPFTINGYEWNVGDWRVDTKSFEKDFQNIYNYGYGTNGLIRYDMTRLDEEQAERELSEFKKKHPDAFKGKVTGKLSEFADYYEDENEGEGNEGELSGVGMGLSNEGSVSAVQKDKETIAREKKEKDEQIRKNVPGSAQNLLMNQLKFNDSIRSDSKTPSLNNDPITLSIIYSADRDYLTDIKNNQQLQELYSQFLKKMKELGNVNKLYKVRLGIDYENNEKETNNSSGKIKSVLQLKKEYDEYSDATFKIIQEKKHDDITLNDILNNEKIKTELFASLNKLINIKKEYLKKTVEVLKLFEQKIIIQHEYIQTFVQFYTALGLVKEHQLLILDKEKNRGSEFALNITIELIKFDTETYTSLWKNEDYISQLNGIQEDVQNKIKGLNHSIEKMYNVREEFENIYNHPELLNIEKYQYDCYYLNIILYSQKNEYIMWRTLSTRSDEYFKKISDVVFKNITETFRLFQNYNDTYDSAERAAFLQKLEIGETPIQNQTTLQYLSFNKDQNKYKTQKKMFLTLKSAEVISYQWITLYTRISTIQLARKIAFLSIQKNISKIYRDIYVAMKFYYNRIQKNIPQIEGLLPHSIYWNVNDYYDSLLLVDEITNNNQNIQNNNTQFKYIEDKFTNLEKEYTDAIDLMIPYISEMGILKSCYKITDPNTYFNTDKLITTNEQELYQFENNYFNNEDESLTNTCRFQFLDMIAKMVNYNIISDSERDKALLDESKNKINSIIVKEAETDSLFGSLVTAFNGELIMKQTITLNKYARSPENEKTELPIEDALKFKFTIQQLRNCVADNVTEEELSYYIDMAKDFINRELVYFVDLINMPDDYKKQLLEKLYEKWRKISFVFVRSFYETVNFLLDLRSKEITNDYENQIDDLVLNKNNLSLLKKIIQTPIHLLNKNEDGIYRGDEVAIKIIENTFKLKLFIIDVHQSPLTIDDYIGKSVVFRQQATDLDPPKEIEGTILSMSNIRDSAFYEYIVDETQESMELIIDTQLYFLNKLNNLIKKKLEDVEFPVLKNKAMLKLIIINIEKLIHFINTIHIHISKNRFYPFMNIFLTDKVKKADSIPAADIERFLEGDPYKYKDRYGKRLNIGLAENSEVNLRLMNVKVLNYLYFNLINNNDLFVQHSPNYVVETNKNVKYKIQMNRIIELEDPFLNIYSNSDIEDDLYSDDSSMGYLFLFVYSCS